MAWGKLDDGYHAHPKIVGAGNEAVGAHARMIAWCAFYLTNGLIPAQAAIDIARGKELVEHMVACRLLDEVKSGGYRVHDYLDWNDSAAQVEARREASHQKKAQAGRAGGLRSGAARRSKREADGEAAEEAETKQNGSRSEAEAKHGASSVLAENRSKTKPDADADADASSDPDPASDSEREASRARAPARNGRPDFDAFAAAWLAATNGKPAGNLSDNAVALDQLRAAATHRKADLAALMPEVIAAYVAEVADAMAAGKHHGGPSVVEFAIGVRGAPSWFNRALARLDRGGKKPAKDITRGAVPVVERKSDFMPEGYLDADELFGKGAR